MECVLPALSTEGQMFNAPFPGISSCQWVSSRNHRIRLFLQSSTSSSLPDEVYHGRPVWNRVRVRFIISSQHAAPPIPGIWRSMNIRSGRSVLAISSASSPLEAVKTRTGESLRKFFSSSRNSFVSSTSSIFFVVMSRYLPDYRMVISIY